MREPEWSLDRLKSEIAALGERGLSRAEYFAELAPRLRRGVPSDASCWHTIDPQTRLLTSDEPRELIDRGILDLDEAAAAGEVIVHSEYLGEEPNSFAALAARRVPVGILAQATRGRPERSARYRDLLEPSGIPHELRAAFVMRRCAPPSSCGAACGAQSTSPAASRAAPSSSATRRSSPRSSPR